MKTTGYKLREAIRTWELRRKIANDTFDRSLARFPGEDKASPENVHASFVKADRAIAKLQTFQSIYNLKVAVSVLGESMTLCEAVKAIGGAGRAEKLWRTAAVEKADRYSYRGEVRNKDEIHAERTISYESAGALAAKAARFAGALRAGIAAANATEIDIEGLEAYLFE